MTPVTVFTPLPLAVPMSGVAALLGLAGLTATSADQWIAECASGDGVPVLLVVVSGDAGFDVVLEAAVRAAVTRGERVVAVWPLGQPSGPLPSVLQDYGAGLVSWDPSALHAAICNQGAEWQDAGGGVRAQSPMDRNKNC